MGNLGQTSYGAANAALDALCAARAALNLPALAVQWGPWADFGMAATLERHLKMIWTPLGAEDGLAGLERALDLSRKATSTTGCVAAVTRFSPLELRALAQKSEFYRRFLEGVVTVAPPAAATAALRRQHQQQCGGGAVVAAALHRARPSKKYVSGEARIAAILKRYALGDAAAALDAPPVSRRSVLIDDLGFDSITQAEIVGTLNREFTLSMTPMLMLEVSTLAELHERIDEETGGALSTAASAAQLEETRAVHYASPAAAARSGSSALSASGFVPPDSRTRRPAALNIADIEAKLATLLKNFARGDAERVVCTAATLVDELAFDSITQAEVVGDINTAFGTKMTPMLMLEVETVGELAERVASEMPAAMVGAALTEGAMMVLVPQPSAALALSGRALRAKLSATLAQYIRNSSAEAMASAVSFDDLGLDSIDQTAIVNGINAAFGLSLPPMFMLTVETPSELAFAVEDELALQAAREQRAVTGAENGASFSREAIAAIASAQQRLEKQRLRAAALRTRVAQMRTKVRRTDKEVSQVRCN